MTIVPKEQLLEQGAQALLCKQPVDRLPQQIRSLLQALEYDPGDAAPVNRHRASLLTAAAGFARLFQLRAPDAPGLVFFGAEVDPGQIHPGGLGQRRLPASGAGLSFRAAFEGCVGEGVELLSQFEADGDRVFQAPDSETAFAGLLAGASDHAAIDWITARHASNGNDVLLPADICLRRGSQHVLTPPWPLSIGCAAGTSPEAAALHALLELIERDAAALWWRGGIRGRLIPLDSETTRHALGLLTPIRGPRQLRQCWLLDITTDLGIPCVAAVSVRQDGLGFACGLASRLSLARAAESAIIEMCQMELAHEVVAAKRRESGDAALNAYDRAHLRRGNELALRDCMLLHPLPSPTDHGLPIEADDAAAVLHQIVEHLARRGIETFILDLTRPAFGIPVVRVMCPMLEKEPSEVVGDRLRTAIQDTGGGHAHTGGIPLM